ncbi:hypothetical protein ACH5RR_014689 [Cinchona calisaya]|uniref:Cystatin domain-containing protein n=1 Tax=Cinchona calisaya TaxID=153742 RepID=A0ABD2ZQZ6_9GENT
MALNFHHMLLRILTFLLVSLPFNSNAVSAEKCLLGGYCPRNPNDPLIKNIATFAVVTHNSDSNSSLEFDNVAEAQSQVVKGVNYRLVIKVNETHIIENFPNVYQALVYQGLNGNDDLHLQYFKKLTTV